MTLSNGKDKHTMVEADNRYVIPCLLRRVPVVNEGSVLIDLFSFSITFFYLTRCSDAPEWKSKKLLTPHASGHNNFSSLH